MAQERINGDRDGNADVKEFAPASVVGLINNVENGTINGTDKL